MKQASFQIGNNKIISTEKDNTKKVIHNYNENIEKKLENSFNEDFKTNKPKKLVENVYYFK